MPGIVGRILANRAMGSEMFTIVEVTMASGAAIPYHRHATADGRPSALLHAPALREL